MAYKILKYTLLVTPAAGSVSWNTAHIHGDLLSVHIKPTTDTAQYFFQILDPEGLELYSTVPVIQGELNDEEVAKSVNEILTCSLLRATIDEEYRVTIRIRQYQNSRV